VIALNHRRKFAIATYSASREANIYGKLTVDATQALAYVNRKRVESGVHVTITHLVGRAVAEGLKNSPALNGRLVGTIHLANPDVNISFLVAIPDDDDLGKVKIEHADRKSVVEIARELIKRAELLRQGKDKDYEGGKRLLKALPAWAIGPIANFFGFLTSGLGLSLKPLGLESRPFGAAVITNVGVFGIDEGYVPPTPWARVPVWLLIGTIRELPAIVDGKVVPRPMLTLTATVDHRFVDGQQGGNLTKTVRQVLENPWLLDETEGSMAP
jgi:pyruvate dehydrogenase E2 component (dihydrolipoamide acetyltransferase)